MESIQPTVNNWAMRGQKWQTRPYSGKRGSKLTPYTLLELAPIKRGLEGDIVRRWRHRVERHSRSTWLLFSTPHFSEGNVVLIEWNGKRVWCDKGGWLEMFGPDLYRPTPWQNISRPWIISGGMGGFRCHKGFLLFIECLRIFGGFFFY